MPFAPASEIKARLERFQSGLSDAELDGALLHGVTNLLYFAGTAQQAHLWVPAAGEAVLLVRRVMSRARADSPLERLEPLRSLKALPDTLGSARRIGFELDIMAVSLFERYKRALPGLDATDVGLLTRLVRSVKSPYEIERVRAAARASDVAFQEIVSGFRSGQTELELAIVAESAMRRAGFQGFLRWRAPTGFECPWVHVLAGESALAFSFADAPFGGEGVTPAVPYGPGSRRIEPGVPVCIDFALGLEGYINDQTRTLALGQLDDRLLAAYEVCREIHRRFRAEARPGVTGEALWEQAVDLAEEAGLGEHFMGHGPDRVGFVGHGVGLEIDELPVLAPRQQQRLEAGNVIAIEPKFFFPGLGAVGLESTYAIHAAEVERLTITPEELVVR